MRDFAVSVSRSRRPVPKTWRSSNAVSNENSSRYLWQALGVVLVVIMLAGILSSFMVGYQIKCRLSGIAEAKIVQDQQRLVKVALLAERESLLLGARIDTAAAEKADLYSPGFQQRISF